MCELFGLSSDKRILVNPYLKTLQTHSTEHPHGWGIAAFYGTGVSIEKEPKPAWVSDYLNSRLHSRLEVKTLIAHIRLATRGRMDYENCHPFVERDDSERAWTLAHNGTIFQSELLDQYKSVQFGATDSERILCHVIKKANERLALGKDMNDRKERCLMMDEILHEITEHNKVNLMVYDGELLYIHTNMAHTLYRKEENGSVFFATVPLDKGNWEPVPMMQLLAYDHGKVIFEGSKHEYEYRKPDIVIDTNVWPVL